MNPRYLLDTNVISVLARRSCPAILLDRIEANEGRLAIASLVWHELRFGCERLPPSARRRELERFLVQVVGPMFEVLDYDRRAADWHAQERARLAREGRTLPFVDGQIAAMAAVNELVLVSESTRDFEHFTGLQVEDWLGPEPIPTPSAL